MKMTDDDLLSITQQLLNEAQTYMEESITKDRAKAMRYYKGETPDNLPTVVGRSQMVVTEVRDTIEWIMPDLCKIFTGGEQVASIEPHGSEDSFDADIADEWVNYVIMRQNQGFLNTYTWIKDALLSKTGFLKQYWKVDKIRVRNDRLIGGAGDAHANNFGSIAKNITSSIQNLPGLLTGLSYLFGILLGVLGILGGGTGSKFVCFITSLFTFTGPQAK